MAVKRLGFRGRLFLILLLFAVVPSLLLTLAWSATVQWAVPLVGATAALETIAQSGHRAMDAARGAPLTPAQRAAVDAHARALDESVLRARQMSFIARRAPAAALALALLAVAALGLLASRVAGHLSRRVGRPLFELVTWAEKIGRGEPLPERATARGAPEFEVLRTQMRIMARELELGRARALEAERGAAMRETARQVAHEIKNPLTPIRFAVARLQREVPPELAETVEVLAAESERLDRMARSFSQFGRLPEGPRTEVDLGELVTYSARTTVPDEVPLAVEVEEGLPLIHGQYDALARALSNVLINAVEACGCHAAPPAGTSPVAAAPAGGIHVRVRRAQHAGAPALAVEVQDAGPGIAPERIPAIWNPYVTSKQGGTGLGLAIVRQTILAHGGAVEASSAPGEGTTIRLLLPVTGTHTGVTTTHG
ncbi:MAG TPA: ATP-binding protein [Gemmatimonadaceae bacterium]